MIRGGFYQIMNRGIDKIKNNTRLIRLNGGTYADNLIAKSIETE
jgi:hypothetical protein